MLRRAYLAMQRHLKEEWEGRDPAAVPYRTPYDGLIMASIIEKETGQSGERDMIGALAHLGIEVSPRDFAFRSDNHLAQLAAIRAGIGIGPCQVGLAEAPVPLVRVLPGVAFPLEVWLVVHHDLRAVARVRVVCDHLAEHLGAYAGRSARRAAK